MLFVEEGEAHGHDAVTVACGLLVQFPGNRVFHHETHAGEASLALWLSRPVEGVASTSLIETAILWEADFTESSDVYVESGKFVRHECGAALRSVCAN